MEAKILEFKRKDNTEKDKQLSILDEEKMTSSFEEKKKKMEEERKKKNELVLRSYRIK